MKTPINFDDYKYEEATHLLSCKHCIGDRCRYYYMRCFILGTTKSGKIKILVFGERNWKNKEHIKNIKYVESNKLTFKND